MAWYDHMPKGMTDWSQPHTTEDGGINVDGHYFPKEYLAEVLNLVPMEELKKAERETHRLEKENAEFRDKDKKAKKAAAEAEKKAKLKKLRPDTDTASHWRWSKGEKRRAWLQWNPDLEIFYDTGARLTDKGIEYPPGWVFPEGYTP
jgi:hypothetical protein